MFFIEAAVRFEEPSYTVDEGATLTINVLLNGELDIPVSTT